MFPDHVAIIHGPLRRSYADLYARCRRLASRTRRAGHRARRHRGGDARHTPEMIEVHYGVPMTGAVLNTLNTRLDADGLAFCLDHGEAGC